MPHRSWDCMRGYSLSGFLALCLLFPLYSLGVRFNNISPIIARDPPRPFFTSKLGLHECGKKPLLTRTNPLVAIRGGSLDDEDEDIEYDDEDHEDHEDDDEDDDDLLLDDNDNEFESSFEEGGIVKQLTDLWGKTPPLTKLYLKASAAATLFGFLFNNNDFPKILSLEWKLVFTKLQIWRPFTAFLNFGPFGLVYILTAQFIWEYMSSLERLSHKKPYDFWLMIVFGQMMMAIIYPLFKLKTKMLGHNLSTFFVYIWARHHEGVIVNVFFGLFNINVGMLPWYFAAKTLLFEGEPPVVDCLGIAFGHIYYHYKSTGLLRVPSFIVDWYDDSTSNLATRIRNQYKKVSSDFEVVE